MEFIEDFDEKMRYLEKMYIPNEEKTKEALGDVKREIRNERVSVCFSDYIVKNFHKRMTIESLGDWIPSTQETSQNYDGWKMSGYNELYQDRKTIYIQCLDSSLDDEYLENCKKYCEAFFFGLPVEIRPRKNIKKLGIKFREREEGKYIQYDARDILRRAQKWIPDDAY